ncbi:hypothetical protein VPH35_109177 [Triticum aestivum]
MPPPFQGAGEGGDRGSRAPAPDPSRRGAGLGQDQGQPPARLHSPSQNPPHLLSPPPPSTPPSSPTMPTPSQGPTPASPSFPTSSLPPSAWVRALAQRWGPNRPGRYRRHTKGELIDKIDIDMLADDGAASEEEEEKKEMVRRV